MRFKLALLLICAALVACKSGGKQLPNQVNIRISPSEQEWLVHKPTDDGSCPGIDYARHQDNVVSVRVSDGQGRALGDTEVLFSLSLSGNSYDPTGEIYQGLISDITTGLPMSIVELYHDRNGDMRPQAEELVSGVEDALFTARTDRYNGSIQLIVRMNLTCRYKASLQATVGGFSNQAEFSVEYEDDL